MKWELAFLLALCTIAAAMVPRERRAVDTDSSTPEPPKNICASTTPCGWSFYNPYTKMVTTEVLNTYCVCADGFSCEEHEDDSTVSTIVKRCKKI